MARTDRHAGRQRSVWPGSIALIAAAFAVFVATSPSARAQPGDPHSAPSEAYKDQSSLDPVIVARGEQVYSTVCAACHDTGATRAPPRMILGQFTPDSIYRVLTVGIMKDMAAGLSDEQKKDVAQTLAQRPIGTTAAAAGPKMCQGAAARFDLGEPPPFTGWGFDPASTHAVPDGIAGLDRASAPKLKLAWAVGFPDALRARSQPGVAGGALFVGSHDGTVYALDRATGCTRWTFHANGEVRTGIVVAPWRTGDAKARPLAYFGDILGNLYAVEALTGKLAWRVRMDDHPSATLTATPVLHGKLLYVPVSSLEEGTASNPVYPCCTFRGSIAALDPATGKQAWRTYLVPPSTRRGQTTAGVDRFGPSGVAIWSSPAIDQKRGLLYVTTGDNYTTPATGLSDAIIALELTSGKMRWAYQAQPLDAWNGSCSAKDRANCPEEDGPDFDFGAGPVVAKGKDGRDYVLAGQKSGIAYAVDPDRGKLVWKRRVGRGGVVGGIHFGMTAVDGRLFVPVSDVPDGRTYDIAPQPGLYALDITSGEILWKSAAGDVCDQRPLCHPGYSGAISSTPQLVLAGSNDGYLRILDAASGKPLWETSTVQDYRSVNGIIAHGGSMGGGAAPVVYKGMLVMPSGYGFAGKMPGNVLLAFTVQ